MYVGVDIGSTGLKVLVIDEHGRIISKSYFAYFTGSNQKGQFEYHGAVICKVFKQALHQALMGIEDKQAIKTISFSSLGEAFVPIDRSGKVLMNSILGTDRRGTEEFGAFIEKLKPGELAKISGHCESCDFSVSKLLWIKKYHPEIYDKTWKFLLYEDWLGYCLTGRVCIDYSLASRTMLFDIEKKQWSRELAEHAGIDVDKLAEPVQSGSVIGTLLPSIAKEFGLSEKTLVVAGGHDVCCALLGCGALSEGIAVDTTGTTECISAVLGEQRLSGQCIEKEGLVCEPYLLENTFNTLAFMWNAGSIVEWYLRKLLHTEAYRGKSQSEMYAYFANNTRSVPQKVFVLPHFSGTGTLHPNVKSAGAIINLTMDTEDADIYQAILESITYEMKLNLQKLRRAGVCIEKLIAVGGGAKSAQWLQIKANIFDLPIWLPENQEAGAMGCAILGARASGTYRTISEAVGEMVRVKQKYTVEAEKQTLYQECFEIYQEISGGVRSIYKKII